MTAADAPDDYVLGHSERELARLEAQAAFYADATRDGLLKAGIAPGMKLLDLGCGVGDVSLIAARIAGAAGSVTGIDISDAAVAVAARRAAAESLRTDFIKCAVADFGRYADFDAVVGRFILVHFPDPVAALRDIAGRMRRGATLVSMEMDMGTASATAPFPLLDYHLGNIRRMYASIGLSPDMGARLHAAYRAAGLEPTLTAFTRVGNAREAAGFGFLAESVRSLMPMLEKLGIATPDEIGIGTLAQRLAAEAAATDPAIFYPRFVVAWAKV